MTCRWQGLSALRGKKKHTAWIISFWLWQVQWTFICNAWFSICNFLLGKKQHLSQHHYRSGTVRNRVPVLIRLNIVCLDCWRSSRCAKNMSVETDTQPFMTLPKTERNTEKPAVFSGCLMPGALNAKNIKCSFVLFWQTLLTFPTPETSCYLAAVLTVLSHWNNMIKVLAEYFSNDTQVDAISTKNFGVTPSKRPRPDDCPTCLLLTQFQSRKKRMLIAPLLQVVLQPRHHPSTQ